jgi:DNA-binding PadR family transcriptional regulator
MEDPWLGNDPKSEIFNNEIRKGFLKIILLKIIQKTPTHGYDIIRLVNEKSRGHWMPSPGSVYPALEYLESKGYITSQEIDRKKVYTITPKGEKAIEVMNLKKKELFQELINFLGEI